MYFPYLRSNTNEVLAVLELAPKLVATSLVVPLFNVVKANGAFKGRVKRIVDEGQKVCVIANTGPGAQHSELFEFLDELEGECPGLALPGFEVTEGTTDASVKSFAKRFAKRQTVVVHRKRSPVLDLGVSLKRLLMPAVHAYFDGTLPGSKVHAAPSAGDVIINDGFARAIKNGLYPAQSKFPSYLDAYVGTGYSGFGDFAAIGDHYKAGGGRASNVALHLTERAGKTLVCNHFVSDDAHVDSHVHVQYEDALNKLEAYTGNPVKKVFDTQGVVDGYLADSAYHGLGMPKRWSLKHHMERMDSILVANGAKPFI